MRDFHYTVNVLVKAYLNDTLKHDFCTACAVGNIIAEANNVKLTKNFGGFITWDKCGPHWGRLFLTDSHTGDQMINADRIKYPEIIEPIKATGYKWRELARIEYAFETADKGNNEDEWMFNGLMAVVDVLAEIHGIDLKEKEEAKALFVKH